MATSINLDEELRERVRRLASDRDRSAHWLMQEAIRQYVDREEAQDSFHREAVESWAEYKADGQHLTGGELKAWLALWGTDAPPPQCHD